MGVLVMFNKQNKSKITDEAILNKLYDFVLDQETTERERKIGLLAKTDLEKKRYVVAVVNETMASLQQESMRNGLTPSAQTLYHELDDIMNKIAPIGTNRAAVGFQSRYLD